MSPTEVQKKLLIVVEERSDDADDKRQRAALKLLLELVLHGIISSEVVDPLLRRCCGVGPKGKVRFPVDAPLLGAFLKTGGEELCGVTSRKARLLIAEVGVEPLSRTTVVEDPSSLAQLALALWPSFLTNLFQLLLFYCSIH